ncbi:antitoxin [Phenylobacterium ferrooxidans]|uniref:Antitoxin n=1 Tax=Phenylobacterium ferrooxidans TaxID=2982689 RepID=A0ABW6CYX0_9CAUL
MSKPKFADLFDKQVGPDAERVLVTLLRNLGPWRKSIVLVGGLAPAYLVRRREPDVPAHAGTGDLDVVVDLKILTETDAYWKLEENLEDMGFKRLQNSDGRPVNWRWTITLEGGRVLILEFLADHPDPGGDKVLSLPTEGKVSAVHIPYASMVFDLHDQIEVTAELIGGGGRATETIAYANIVSFTCLKAFAFDHRAERKDAHDLVYCLEHIEGSVDAAIPKFVEALNGVHRDTILKALALLRSRFAPNVDEGHLFDGPVAVALFELGDADADRDARLLRQRGANAVIERLLAGLVGAMEAAG